MTGRGTPKHQPKGLNASIDLFESNVSQVALTESVGVSDELAREKMVVEPCQTLHGLSLKGWPKSSTDCLVCGDRIIYFTYQEGSTGERRAVPRVHNGRCDHLHRLGIAKTKIERYDKRHKA